MAGGPLGPVSMYPTSARGFIYAYEGAGTTEDRSMMHGIAAAADIASDGTAWHLIFEMPQILPSGTAKLRIISRANATTGVIGLNVSWASVAVTESPDDATLNDEGSVDITTSATADRYVETLLTLDADTVVADEVIHMNIDVDDSAHTIAAETGLFFSIIWE